MKNMKKCFSILLALVMAFALAATAMAVGEGGDTPTTPETPATPEYSTAIDADDGKTATITAPSNSRTYEIYQIFAADVSDGKLSNIKWGVNSKTGTVGQDVPQTVIDGLVTANTGDKTVQEKLTEINKYADLTGKPVATVTNGGKATVPTGYYMIRDTGAVSEGEEYSLLMVEIIDNITISPKASTTTSEKKVKDKNDSEHGANAYDTVGWQDSADYDIGDDVPFQLKAIITNNYANYTTYKLTFHDDQSEGLSFNNDAKVYVDGQEITNGFVVKTTELSDTECTFEVVFENLKNIDSVHAGSVITVEYTSKLTGSTVKIGSEGNPNTMHISYSNNPNEESEGETPDDTVIVFTYKVIVNKVHDNPNFNKDQQVSDTNPEHVALPGAGFTLYKKDSTTGEYKAIGEELKADEDGNLLTTFTWTGLDDGDYKLSETTTPAGYNTVADMFFTVAAEHTVESDSPSLTSLSGNAETGSVIAFSSNSTDGSLTAEIENKSGSTLPETGGMGTTVLYIVGGVLVAVAAVMLIVKRRMAAEK